MEHLLHLVQDMLLEHLTVSKKSYPVLTQNTHLRLTSLPVH